MTRNIPTIRPKPPQYPTMQNAGQQDAVQQETGETR